MNGDRQQMITSETDKTAYMMTDMCDCNINLSSGATALYHTFGCKLNFAETATIEDLMMQRGICAVGRGESPDIIVVNSCSVTEIADRKCRRYIRSMHRRYPQAAIIVTGCYAQLHGEDIAAMDGVAAVVGNDKKHSVVRHAEEWLLNREMHQTDITPTAQIRDFEPSCSRGDRTRFFLKVQDGCNYWCSYCTIPKARGRSRSGTVNQVVEQARAAAAAGATEIVITGVNIGDFGHGTSENFFDLARALDKVEGISRYRISSIEPNLITDEIIDWCAGEAQRFMPHFHIPLQSGSDDMLRLMRRHYDTEFFAGKIERIRRSIPDAFIGVDLIVGMRGETDAFFENSYNYCKSLDISRLHLFTYSERPGTRALEIPYAVSPALQHERMQRMLELSRDKMLAFASRFEGTIRPVLLEHPRAGRAMSGFTDNYLKVHVPDATAEYDNRIMPVRLDAIIEDAHDSEEYGFKGTLLAN